MALYECLRGHAISGDSGPLSTVEAAEHAAALRPFGVHRGDAAGPPLLIDRDITKLLTAFHFVRSLLLPEGEREADVDQAVFLARVLRRFEPDQIPEQLAAAIDGMPELAASDMDTVDRELRRLTVRWQTAADSAALDEMIRLTSWIAGVVPEAHPSLPVVLSNLSYYLRLRSIQDGADAGIDAAIEVGERAERLTPADHPWFPTILANLSPAFQLRYARHGDPADLDRAVELARRAARSIPDDSPQYSHCLFAYGNVLLTNVKVRGDRLDLDVAIDTLRRAVAAASVDQREHRALCLDSLAGGLLSRYRWHGDRVDLDAALVEAEHAVDTSPGDGPSRALFLVRLSDILVESFSLSGDVEQAEAATTAARAALAATPRHHSLRAAAAHNLGDNLLVIGNRLRDQSRVDEAIALLRESLADTGPDDPDRPGRLVRLGRAVIDRAESNDRAADAETAVDICRQAVDSCPVDSPQRFAVLLGLGRALRHRGRIGGAIADVDAATAVLRAARDAVPEGHRALSTCLATLADTLSLRYSLSREPADVDRAIAAHEDAIAAAPADGTRIDVGGLAAAVFHRFAQTGTLTDLNTAIDWARQWLRDTAPTAPVRAEAEAQLGQALQARFKRSGSLADLDEAVRLFTAGERRSRSLPSHPLLASALGFALCDRFYRFGDRADIDRAVELGRAAVAATAADDEDLATRRTNLSSMLNLRFNRFGALDDIEAAVAVGREALGTATTDDPGLAVRYNNLANALRNRHGRLGAKSDLDAAVGARRRALECLPDGHAERPAYLSNLATTLLASHIRSQSPAELAEAVTAARRAVDDAAVEHPERRAYLSNLAIILRRRFRATRLRADADAAVAAAEQAVIGTPDDHPSRALSLTNLTIALMDRYDVGGDRADLDAAIDAGRLSVEIAHPNGPDAARCHGNLGLALALRAELTDDRTDLDSALRSMRDSARNPTAPTASRVLLARGWALAATAARDWRQADEAFTLALELLPLLAWHGLEHADRVDALSRISGLASDAAAVALEVRRPQRALRLLELGRGVLFAQVLDSRGDFGELAARAPRLAARMRAVRTELDAARSPVTEPDAEAATDRTPAVEHKRRLAAEWDALLERARGLPGLADFLRPPSVDRLRAATAGGPVVVVNVSQLRCDALIVTPDKVRVVRLPALDAADLTARARELLDVLGAAHGSIAASWKAQRRLTKNLGWLWDAVAEPVLAALPHERGSAAPRRLWWCPTGALSLLPLHAAGHYDGSVDRRSRPRNLPDRAVCSYTPTLRALAAARERFDPSDAAAGVLAVGLPRTPGLAPLPQAEAEVERVAELLPGTVRLTDAAATRAAVLAGLADHGWLHFAGHGGQDPGDANSGALYCHDHREAGPLTIADIANLRLGHARLAFLSACETARGTLELPDEAVHIAGTLQLAGFPHVVATQWLVADRHAARLAQDFYTRLRETDAAALLSPDAAGHCLHAAVRELRRAEAPLLLWASFIHTGP